GFGDIADTSSSACTGLQGGHPCHGARCLLWTNDRSLSGLRALLRCLVDDHRRPLPSLVGKLWLRKRVEFRLLAVQTELRGQPHADAAAVLGLVLGDRSLQ